MAKKYMDADGAAYLLKRIHEIMDEVMEDTVDLTNYVTIEELQEELDALDIDIDLSNYVTKQDLTNALASYVKTSALTSYAKKTDLNDFIKATDMETYVETELDDYATKTYVTNAINNAALGGGDGTAVDLSIYATKEDVNNALDDKADTVHTHTLSEITDYSAPDLSGYVTEAELEEAIENASLNVDLSDYVTDDELTQKLAGKANATHTHNDYLTNTSLDNYATKAYVEEAIQDVTISGGDGNADVHYGTEEPTDGEVIWINPDGDPDIFATKEYVDSAVAKVKPSVVDLSNYYTKEETDALIPEVPEIPDVSGFLTEIPEEYVTETELNEKGFLTEHQDISGKAELNHTHTIADITDYVAPEIPEIPEIPDLSEYAKLEDIPTVPDMTGYAKTSDIPDVSVYQTEEQVIALIQQYAGEGGAPLPSSEEVEF